MVYLPLRCILMIMVLDICVINVGEYTINGSFSEKCNYAGWVFWLFVFSEMDDGTGVEKRVKQSPTI